MSLPIRASFVRAATKPAAGSCRTVRPRWAGLPLVGLAAAIALVGDCPAMASDFKSLLADAGTLVFGDPEPTTPVAPAPPAEATEPAAAPTVLIAQRPETANDTQAGTQKNTSTDTPKPTPKIDAGKTGRDADAILQRLLPPRSDTPADWHASVECLHAPGEPRALTPCVPPPPCDPSQPPHPFDLVGVHGTPSCGPIYRGPCEPRSARHHHGVFAWYHHLCDRMFDHFYRSK